MTNITCDIKPVESIPGDLVGVRKTDLDVRSYAGFTNDNLNHMFGCFYEAQPCMGDDEVANFPLMLWFNGGPGASSMFGAMSENGPGQAPASQSLPVTKSSLTESLPRSTATVTVPPAPAAFIPQSKQLAITFSRRTG